MAKKQAGMTLLELLLYMAIFVAVSGVFIAYLTGVLKISNKETASGEVTTQLNSSLQKINQLIKESSNIEIATSTASSASLKIRMKDPLKDPTCVEWNNVDKKIILKQGPADMPNNFNCTSTAFDLTTSKVLVDSLSFKKMTYYPGHDQIITDAQMSYNSQNPESQFSKTVKSAVSRVSAATFDDHILPGSNNSYNLGASPSSMWKDAFFSGNLLIGANGILEIRNNTQTALRLRKDVGGNAGSVDLFIAVGSGSNQTGNQICQNVSASARCLAHWELDGAQSTCSSQALNGPESRALCADWGD